MGFDTQSLGIFECGHAYDMQVCKFFNSYYMTSECLDTFRHK